MGNDKLKIKAKPYTEETIKALFNEYYKKYKGKPLDANNDCEISKMSVIQRDAFKDNLNRVAIQYIKSYPLGYNMNLESHEEYKRTVEYQAKVWGGIMRQTDTSLDFNTMSDRDKNLIVSWICEIYDQNLPGFFDKATREYISGHKTSDVIKEMQLKYEIKMQQLTEDLVKFIKNTWTGDATTPLSSSALSDDLFDSGSSNGRYGSSKTLDEEERERQKNVDRIGKMVFASEERHEPVKSTPVPDRKEVLQSAGPDQFSGLYNAMDLGTDPDDLLDMFRNLIREEGARRIKWMDDAKKALKAMKKHGVSGNHVDLLHKALEVFDR